MSAIKKPSLILVVDDNKPNRDLMATLVNRMGHEVVSVSNGHEALQTLEEKRFDLVLLDIMMPHVDGYQVLETMRDSQLLLHTPVVVVSALSEIDSVVKCLELGAEDYLYKPINRILLQARVEACLEKKHLREQELQYLQSLNDIKEQFVHTVSHDLKNPIALIMGYTELLLDLGLVTDPEAIDYLQKIRHYSEYMSTLTQDLLDLGKAQHGMSLSLSRISICGLIEKCIEAFKLLAAQKNIALHFDRPANDIVLEADATRMEQVMNNLVSNAIKYTPNAGQVDIGIRREDKHVVISVTDTGLGIPKDDLPFVFDTFYRVKREEHLAAEGTGLGLAIAKAIMEQHQGGIWVESELGAGSQFSVALPLK